MKKLESRAQRHVRRSASGRNGRRPHGAAKPHYRAEDRTLWVGHVLIKRLHILGESQELIIKRCEEQKWRSRFIDRPLGDGPGATAPKCLYDAVRRLNENQKPRLLEFHVDGQRIWWKIIGRD